MPRKAKEKELELNHLKQGAKKETSSNTTAKTVKKEAKKVTTKKKTASKKTDTKSSAAKRKNTKSSTSVKKASKTKSSTSTNSTKTSVKSQAPTIVEYYDLPFRYNQTIVKILAQTPNILFIYWDISDDDRNAYIKKYGADFFQNTRPYLIITNETMHYTFEVEINDFANSWYLHVNDANCQYKVELGRKFIVDSQHEVVAMSTSETPQVQFDNYFANDYLPITSSNEIEMPNNHILFDKLGKSIFFRNVKTNIMSEKEVFSISYLQNIGKIYNIYDLYKEIYHDELISDEMDLNLPSSNSSSF